MSKLRNENHRNVDKRHKDKFPKWFEHEVVRLLFVLYLGLLITIKLWY